jgi:type II secretory pathway component PulF
MGTFSEYPFVAHEVGDAAGFGTDQSTLYKRVGTTPAASGMFDEDVTEMIAVAETANNLGEVLLTIADTTESRVDRLLAAAVKLIEPLLLILLATLVGLIAAALVIPLTQMGRNIG